MKILELNVSGKWCTDEKCVRIRGVLHWIFAVMDAGTRFILSYDISKKKMGYDARSLSRRQPTAQAAFHGYWSAAACGALEWHSERCSGGADGRSPYTR